MLLYIEWLIEELPLPLILMITGFVIWRFPPQYKGMGYHTSTAERSPLAWQTAQIYCGSRIFFAYLAALIITIASWMICAFSKVSQDVMVSIFWMLLVAEVILIFVIIIMTEKMLHNRFDKNGDPK